MSGDAVAVVSGYLSVEAICLQLSNTIIGKLRKKGTSKNRRTYRVHFTYQDKSNFENRIVAILKGGFSINLT